MNAIHEPFTEAHEGAEDPAASTSLAGIDLNLLVALDALLRERSVTRAAGRLGVTQSAMSHTLRRLRDLFEDPLFVRVGGKLDATPRALALHGPLREGLSTLRQALRPTAFDPTRSTRTFRLSSPDLFDVLFLPRLWQRFTDVGATANMSVTSRVEGPVDRLQTGELDVAMVPVFRERFGDSMPEFGTAGLRQRVLLDDSFVCVMRSGHPAARARKTISRKTLLTYPHVLVSPEGSGPGWVDHVLGLEGKRRRVGLRVPTFSSALSIVEQTDLLLCAPSALQLVRAEGPALVAKKLPFTPAVHGLAMQWHVRNQEDPGHRWFREQMLEVSRGLPKSWRSRRARG